MRNLLLHSVKIYLRIGLFFYFRRIKTHGLEQLPKGKPMLLLGNHQSALIDPLLVATQLPFFAHYLTRASVFNNQWVKKLLHFFNMLPVYRIRDGWGNLSNNTPIFGKCKTLLHKGNTIVLFPEGSHNLARRVRPLSKGFTRIVFDTLDTYPDTDLQIVPVGFNYKNAIAYPDSAVIYYGAPISAQDYLNIDEKERVVKLKKDMHKAIAELTTHIPKENYHEILKKLDTLNVNYLDPKAVNTCIKSQFKSCLSRPKDSLKELRVFLKVLLKVSLFLPYLVWKLGIQPKIKELEFIATFRFAVAITLAPLFVLVLSLLLATWFGLYVAMLYVVCTLILALVTVKL